MGRGNTARAESPVGFWLRRTRAEWAGLYILALAALALGLLSALIYVQIAVHSMVPPGRFSWLGFVLLLFLAVFAERYLINVGHGIELSAGVLAYLVSGAILGPLAAFIIAVAGQLPSIRTHEWQRYVCYTATSGIMTGSASLCYWALAAWIGSGPILLVAVGAAAGVIFYALNYGIYMPVAWLRRGIGAGAFWREAFRPFLPFDLFFLAISLGLIHIYRLYSVRDSSVLGLYTVLLIALCLLPVVGLIYAFRAYSRQLELADLNAQLARRNESLALQSIAGQVTALDLKDNYTASHSAAVSQWATDIAIEMGLDSSQVNLTQLASLLHDIGKIGVPDGVLNSTKGLDSLGAALIESHCVNGHKILSTIDQFDELARVVLHHHERWDGAGYPDKLQGEAIPLVSRIICVADSYSAMVSNRPYRKALPVELARGELDRQKGSQFDSDVVDCFLYVLGSRDDAYQRGEAADFRMELQKVRFLRELPISSQNADCQ